MRTSHTSRTSTPVVILRAIRQGGLCIARSLGSLGIPVYAVDPSRWTPTAFSRYCLGHFQWDLEDSPAGQSVDFLLDVARRIGHRPILIPTTDDAALFVADHAESLREAFSFPDQRAERARVLANKASMFHLAKRSGIPTPDTFYPKSRSSLLAFLETAEFPIILKALDYRRQRKRSAETKVIANSRRQAIEKYDRMQDPEQPNLVLQEYIPGGDDTVWMFNGYFNRDSDCLFGMTGQKIRQCPVYTGSTCLGVCLRNDTVFESTLHFMKSIGYRGILDIGYRYDARDGRYKVLDVNPRIGSTFRLFVGEGDLDVARALYLDLTGHTVPCSSPRYGRKWIVEDWDLVSSIRYYLDRKLTAKDWLQSFRGVQETCFLSVRDPLPAVSVMVSNLWELGTRVLNRAGRWFARHRRGIGKKTTAGKTTRTAAAQPGRALSTADVSLGQAHGRRGHDEYQRCHPHP